MKFLHVSWCNIQKTNSLICTVALIEESFKPHILVFSYQEDFQPEICHRGANSIAVPTFGRLLQRYMRHVLFQAEIKKKANSDSKTYPLKLKGHEMWKMLVYFWYRFLSRHDFSYPDESWPVNSQAWSFEPIENKRAGSWVLWLEHFRFWNDSEILLWTSGFFCLPVILKKKKKDILASKNILCYLVWANVAKMHFLLCLLYITCMIIRSDFRRF